MTRLGLGKILAITKRPAELCATQAIIYSVGLEMVTATNINAAESVLRAVPISGVMLCKDSWPEPEREKLDSYVRRHHPELSIILRCPGCTGCDELKHTPGELSDGLAFRRLLETSRYR